MNTIETSNKILSLTRDVYSDEFIFNEWVAIQQDAKKYGLNFVIKQFNHDLYIISFVVGYISALVSIFHNEKVQDLYSKIGSDVMMALDATGHIKKIKELVESNSFTPIEYLTGGVTCIIDAKITESFLKSVYGEKNASAIVVTALMHNSSLMKCLRNKLKDSELFPGLYEGFPG